MSTTGARREGPSGIASVVNVGTELEVLVIPVWDLDRSKTFPHPAGHARKDAL